MPGGLEQAPQKNPLWLHGDYCAGRHGGSGFWREIKNREWEGLPWRSSGYDSALQLQRARVQSLLGELRSQRLGDTAGKKKKLGNGSLGVRAGCQPQYEWGGLRAVQWGSSPVWWTACGVSSWRPPALLSVPCFQSLISHVLAWCLLLGE